VQRPRRRIHWIGPNVLQGYAGQLLKIGELTELTGTSVATIRYCEQIGLLQQAPRQADGQRVYSRDVVERLTFIHRSRIQLFD
jgi:DNA-binding transcriptional MerR regulator